MHLNSKLQGLSSVLLSEMNQKFPAWLKYATLSAVFIAEREVGIGASTRGKMTKKYSRTIRLD